MSIEYSNYVGYTTNITPTIPIGVSPGGNIYLQGNSGSNFYNNVYAFTGDGSQIASIQVNNWYTSFCTDYSNNRIYCAGATTGKIEVINTSTNSLVDAYLYCAANDITLGNDGFIYAVTPNNYGIFKVQLETRQRTDIFTGSLYIQEDACGNFGGCVVGNDGYLYCITRGIGYIYRFTKTGTYLGLFSTVNSAYGSTFALTYDELNGTFYTSTTGSTAGVYMINKYGKPTLSTTIAGNGGSHGIVYDKVTNRLFASTTGGYFYRLAPTAVPATTSYGLTAADLALYYPFDTDLLDYSSGTGVSNALAMDASLTTLHTVMTTGSTRFPGTATQYFKLPNISYATSGLTIAMWLRCNNIVGYPFQLYISRVFDFGNGPGTDNLAFSFGYGGVSYIYTNNKSYDSYKLTDTLWHHYCITVDTSGNARFYVDGAIQQLKLNYAPFSSVPANLSYSTVFSSCYLFKSNTDSAAYANLDANINQFLLFNRAITATELANISSFYKIINIIPVIPPYPCFLEGSKILRLNMEYDEEEYVQVERLKKGDIIKTATCGYKAILFIGKATLKHPANDLDPKNRLYTFQAKGFRPLSITGEHCTLHAKLSEEKRQQVREYMGDDYITESFYRVPACLDDRAEPYTGKGPATIWHFALEHNNLYNNYAVYANGILVETCSIDYLLNRSNMELQ